jgi:alkanesulfonate monooxygenase SsuD/methylene tetrahydromethanopterin reductase-like flavin-dependent oxidoreductase (luciferase family)
MVRCSRRHRFAARLMNQMGNFSMSGENSNLTPFYEQSQSIYEGPSCLGRVTDDKLVEAFSITGTPDECRRKIKDYETTLPQTILHTPYVPPLAEEDSADAFYDILATFSR